MNPSGLVTSVAVLLAHIWMWRNAGNRALRFAILLPGAAALAAPWLDAAEIIHRTPWMPGIVRAALTATGTLWGFTTVATILLIVLRRELLRRVPGRRQFLRTASGAAVLVPVAVVGYGAFIVRTQFRVKEVEFPVPNLHPDLAGLRLLQISDLHAGEFLGMKDVARVIDMANELKPSLALFTGDLITQPGDPLDAVIAQVARLRADAGVLACHGNHEIYAECEAYATAAAARQGVTYLRGTARQLRWGAGTLNVAGVDYQNIGLRQRYIPRAGNLVLPHATNLLLSHSPDVFPTAVAKGFDAMLAGHTHGGQVTVEILQKTLNITRFFTPYVAGLYRLNARSCYVTNGVGTIGMPVRFGAPPEVVLLTLRQA